MLDLAAALRQDAALEIATTRLHQDRQNQNLLLQNAAKLFVKNNVLCLSLPCLCLQERCPLPLWTQVQVTRVHLQVARSCETEMSCKFSLEFEGFSSQA